MHVGFVATRSRLVAASALLGDRRSGAAFGLILGSAAFLVALLDVLSLTLLLIGIVVLVSLEYRLSPARPSG